jgi:glucose-1-phosphate thymidylyltransferase
VNEVYMDRGELFVRQLGRGVAWLDAGTHESLLNASNFVATLEKRQGLRIGSPEEIALRKAYITPDDVRALAAGMGASPYAEYLVHVADRIQGGAPP